MQGKLLFRGITPLQHLLYKNLMRTTLRTTQLIKPLVPCHKKYMYSRLFANNSGQSGIDLNFLELNKIANLTVCQEDVKKALECFQVSKDADISPPADVLSSVLHLLATNGLHSQLDKLYKSMQDHGYHMGQGVSTTLIRSYVSRKMWTEAIGVLNYMEENQLMRHTRSYNPVITGLAEQGYSLDAFELFEKKIKMYHYVANKRENVIRDTNMFVAMIHSCCITDSLQKPMFSDLFIKNDSKNCETRIKLSDIKETHSLVIRLFDFFHHFGIKIPLDILQACQKWFTFDQSHSWQWRNCCVNKAGKCHLCGVQLENNIPNGYFNNLEKEILQLLSDSHTVLKLSQEEINELKGVHDICLKNGPFDVIIDGQNIGLEGKRKGKNSTKLFGKRLMKVVNHFSKQGQKIFLPLHYKALENDISEKLLEMLRNQCETWIIKSNINDDLLLLYAAASNGLNNNKTCIVSNDNWRDHSVMFLNDTKLKLLKWARLNHVLFRVNHNNHISLFKNLFDPVVQRSNYAWHFPIEDGSWKCARLQK